MLGKTLPPRTRRHVSLHPLSQLKSQIWGLVRLPRGRRWHHESARTRPGRGKSAPCAPWLHQPVEAGVAPPRPLRAPALNLTPCLSMSAESAMRCIQDDVLTQYLVKHAPTPTSSPRPPNSWVKQSMMTHKHVWSLGQTAPATVSCPLRRFDLGQQTTTPPLPQASSPPMDRHSLARHR